MATVNLATKFSPKLDERYKLRSRTDAFTGTNWEWNGANAIKMWTLIAADLNDYNNAASANRFGTPSEVDDEVNTYALTKKRSFSKVFDITNVQDTMMVRRAAAYLKQVWDEKYVPEIDKYRFQVWANGAGQGELNTTKLTKSTVMEKVLLAHAALDDKYVPEENRATFIRSDIAVNLKLADEMKNQQNWIDKTVIKGKIGEVNGSPIISVPKGLFPDGMEFMVKHKQATADPIKLRMLRANDNAPGYAGTLMEGLCRYDSFVDAIKADGIYVYFESGMAATPTASFGSSKLTLTSTDSSPVIKYTTDGTNPKQSSTAQTYSTPLENITGKKVLFYAELSGKINSPIGSYQG